MMQTMPEQRAPAATAGAIQKLQNWPNKCQKLGFSFIDYHNITH